MARNPFHPNGFGRPRPSRAPNYSGGGSAFHPGFAGRTAQPTANDAPARTYQQAYQNRAKLEASPKTPLMNLTTNSRAGEFYTVKPGSFNGQQGVVHSYRNGHRVFVKKTKAEMAAMFGRNYS